MEEAVANIYNSGLNFIDKQRKHCTFFCFVGIKRKNINPCKYPLEPTEGNRVCLATAFQEMKQQLNVNSLILYIYQALDTALAFLHNINPALIAPLTRRTSMLTVGLAFSGSSRAKDQLSSSKVYANGSVNVFAHIMRALLQCYAVQSVKY